MASSATCASVGLGENGSAQAVGSRRNLVNAHAGRIVNGVENRRGCRNYGLLADSFRAERADGRRIFDQDGFDWRNVPGRGDQIVMQVLALSWEEFFHQRHAQSLRNSAFDLAFNERGIDGVSNVVG